MSKHPAQSRTSSLFAAIFITLALILSGCGDDAPSGPAPTPTTVNSIAPATLAAATPATVDPALAGPALPAGVAVYRADLQRSGHFSTTGIAADPQVKWRFKTGGGVASTPVVAGDLVYFGSDDRNFYAVDRPTGEQRWQVVTPGVQGPQGEYGYIGTAAAVAGDRVYFTGADDNLYAVDAASGEQKWKYQLTGNAWSSPAVAGTMLLVGDGTGLRAFSLEPITPTLRWTFSTFEDEPSGTVVTSPALAGNSVYIGGSNGVFYSVGLSEGQRIWSSLTGANATVYSTPAIAGGGVYFGGGGDDNWYLYAVDAARGNLHWGYKTGSTIDKAIATAEGLVFFVSGEFDRTGRVATARFLHAVDGATGQERWRFAAEQSVTSAASVAEGVVYLGADNQLYALEMQTGAVKWQLDVPGGVLSDITVADGVVYFGSGDGYVYAVD